MVKAATFPVLLLLATHAGMIAWLAATESPNVDEPAHLAAGMAMWQYGLFDVYCVNPPLVRVVATLPILLMPHEDVWGDFGAAPRPRPEFVLGAQLVESHPDTWRRFLIAGRLMLLPFSILGGVFCYLWAKDLFGRAAGLLALALWCFSPDVLTWSSLICTDGVAAALGVGAGYSYWRWLRQPTWRRAGVAGILLGAALVAKLTWLILFPLWPVLWWLSGFSCAQPGERRAPFRQLAAILLIGLYGLNLCYAFDGVFTPLGDFAFHSHLLTGSEKANRFATSWLSSIPVPFPRHYVLGIDLQKVDFEVGMPSYLFGEWAQRGWWYYYLIGLALKVPLGTWGLALIAAGTCIACRRNSATHSARNGRNPSAYDLCVLLLPALAVLVLVSSQDGFSRHFRYVLPAMPLAFIWIGQVANRVSARNLAYSTAVCLLIAWSIGSSLAAFPQTMSYFNEIAGGSANGHYYMLGSSFSWSENDFDLQRWIADHPTVDSPYMMLERSVSLERLGLRSRGAPPRACLTLSPGSESNPYSIGPVPGWHAISVQHIHDPDGGYLYFLQFQPFATIGHSIYVYRIDEDEANRVRSALGIPLLPTQQTSNAHLLDALIAGRDTSLPVAVALLSLGEEGATIGKRLREIAAGTPQLSITAVSADEIRQAALDGFDVLVVPGGKATIQGTELGADGRTAIRQFVKDGGGYVGICAGAYLATMNHDWSLKLVNAMTVGGTQFVPGHGSVDVSFRGWGDVSVQLTSEGRSLFKGVPPNFTLSHTGGPVFLRANEPSLPDYEPIGYFRSEIWKYPIQKGTMLNTPAILASRFGRGKVILFSPHPESALGLDRLVIQAILGCAEASRR